MDKKCSTCDKTVYPIEQLKCLDQVWHKGCFKCQVCGMTLNMKNYKGFEKRPYCGAHYPQPKSYTFVSDNPEMQRVKQNTAVISNVQYHSDFEKAKGRYTAVTDDPESLRHRQNAQVVSNVKYHEDFEKGRGARAAPGGGAPEQLQQQQQDDWRAPLGGGVGGGGGFNPHSIGGVSYTEKRQHQPQPQQHHQQPHQPQFQHQQQSHQPQFQHQQQPHQPQFQHQQQPHQTQHQFQQQPQYQHQQQQPHQPQYQPQHQYQQPQQQRKAPADRGRCYKALYSYSANDSDEVSFNEGDLIINGDPIDEGWMYGVVERTGQFGMLPANYVAAV